MEIITLKEYRNGSSDVAREYAILFESPGDIPKEYLERPANPEITPYEVIDLDTKKSDVVNFTTVDVRSDFVVRENRKMLCASGPVYTKEFTEYPKSNRKRIEIKVSPKKKVALEAKPTTEKVEELEGSASVQTTVAELVTSTMKYEAETATEMEDLKAVTSYDIITTDATAPNVKAIGASTPRIVEETTSSRDVRYKDSKDSKTSNNGKNSKKKKKKIVSEVESSKRFSMYHSLIRNELGDSFKRPPKTRKHATVTNKPVEIVDENSRQVDEMESQPSFSNAIITFSPYATQAFPYRTPKLDNKLDIPTFCARGNEHLLLVKVKIAMEHKVIPPEGDALLLPVMEMEKQVEFGLDENSINKTESVTALSINDKWENFLNDLNQGNSVNYNTRYSGSTMQHRSGHYGNNGGSTYTIMVDEATKYVKQLQNSLGSCAKHNVNKFSDIKPESPTRTDNEKQESSKQRNVNRTPNKATARNNIKSGSTQSDKVNYYVNQPSAKDLVSPRRASPQTQPKKQSSFSSDSEGKNKNRSVVVTDVKRNHAKEEYIIEEMIDPQPSDTSSKRITAKPKKHVRKYSRIVIQGDDPESAQVEEFYDVSGSGENSVEGQSEKDVITVRPIADTVKVVPRVAVPETTSQNVVTTPFEHKRVATREGNFFVNLLGTLSTILHRLAT